MRSHRRLSNENLFTWILELIRQFISETHVGIRSFERNIHEIFCGPFRNAAYIAARMLSKYANNERMQFVRVNVLIAPRYSLDFSLIPARAMKKTHHLARLLFALIIMGHRGGNEEREAEIACVCAYFVCLTYASFICICVCRSPFLFFIYLHQFQRCINRELNKFSMSNPCVWVLCLGWDYSDSSLLIFTTRRDFLTNMLILRLITWYTECSAAFSFALFTYCTLVARKKNNDFHFWYGVQDLLFLLIY